MTTLLWPNGQAVEPARSDGYGPRESILTDAGWTRPFHVGTDHYGLGIIRSPGAGTVIESEWSWWAGNQVLIYLGEIDGRRTWVRLCHLAAPSPLARGDQITRGGFVGTEGATGQAVGRHLHWEIYVGRVDRGTGSDPGTTVDPRAFIISHLPGAGTPAGTIRNEDDMPLDYQRDYEPAKLILQRAFAYDLRPRGAGATQEYGPTLWERLDQIEAAVKRAETAAKQTVTPEQVKLIGDQVVKAIGQPTAVVDYAAIAKAVNDDAARRLAS